MLISVTLENWMSFREPVKFSMVAGRERHHRERVPKLGSRLRVLPISAIYGANASGKSNFFRAFCFAKDFVLNNPGKDGIIPVIPFRLSEKNPDPTNMTFEIFSDGHLYEYFFSINARKVFKEKLSRVFLDGSSKILFDLDRSKKNSGKGKPVEFPCAANAREKDRLNFVLEGTLEHQLFINNALSQRMTNFEDIILWFQNLQTVDSEAKFRYLHARFKGNINFALLSERLKELDTGVDGFTVEEKQVTHDDIKDLARRFEMEDFWGQLESLEINARLVWEFNNLENSVAFVKRKDGIYILMSNTIRKDNKTGEVIKGWNISMESDGTKRIIDLLPILPDLNKENNRAVYIVDELERSLHPNMARSLIQSYLNCCSEKTRHQLIFSTHDSRLMDQSLLRRDEMWLTERGVESDISRMFSISDYPAVRDDTDISKNYLMGVFGGTPRIRQRG